VRVAVIADDLTGAADAGVQFARAGHRTAVAFAGAPLPPAADLDVVVADTDSRMLGPEEAAACVRTVAHSLMRAPLVFKKLDSTLRGPVAAEVRAALEGSGRRAAVVAPAFPAGGRTTRGGVQHVDGRPVDATAFRDDPGRPVREADVRRLLAAAGAGPVALLSRADLGDPARIAAAVRAHGYVVADAEDDADLAALVRGVPDPADVLWVGSAGLAGALAACHPGPQPPAPCSAARATAGAPVLAAIGSAHPATTAQVARLAARPDVAEVPLSVDLLARGDHAEAVAAVVEDAARALAHGRSVVVHMAAAPGPPRHADLADHIPRALAAVAERLAAAAELGGLVLSGGETAVCVGRALGARGLLLDEELEPGVPVGRLLGPRPFRVVTKAGGFGGPDTLVRAVEVLGGRVATTVGAA